MESRGGAGAGDRGTRLPEDLRRCTPPLKTIAGGEAVRLPRLFSGEVELQGRSLAGCRADLHQLLFRKSGKKGGLSGYIPIYTYLINNFDYYLFMVVSAPVSRR